MSSDADASLTTITTVAVEAATASTSTSSPLLKNRRKPKSVVWKYYETIVTDDGLDGGGHEVLSCLFCALKIKPGMAKNATKLRQHLVEKCMEVPADVRDSLRDVDLITGGGGGQKITKTAAKSLAKQLSKQIKREVNEDDYEEEESFETMATTTTTITPIISRSGRKSKPNVKYIDRYVDEFVGHHQQQQQQRRQTSAMASSFSRPEVADDENDESLANNNNNNQTFNETLNKRQLVAKVKKLKDVNTRLSTQLGQCLQQMDILSKINKQLEQSVSLMFRLDSVNRAHSIRFEDNDEEVEELTEQLNASNEAVNEWKVRLEAIIFENRKSGRSFSGQSGNKKSLSDSTTGTTTSRTESSIWRYFHCIDKEDYKEIKCVFCEQVFRKKKLNAFQSRLHIVETCDKCPKDIRDKENIWRPKSRINIWQHFNVTGVEGIDWCALCRYCGHKYQHKNATKARKHLLFNCSSIPDDSKQSIRKSYLAKTTAANALLKTTESSLMSVTNNDDNMDDDNNISGSSGQTKDPNEIHWTDGYVDVNTTTTNTTADEMDGELVTADNSGGGVDEDETPDDSTERLQLVLPPVRHKSTVDVWIHYMLLGNKCCVCKYCGHKYYTKNATKCRTHLLQNCPNIDKDIKQSIIDEHMKNVEKNDSCYLSPKTNNNNKNTDRVLSSSGVKPKSRVWDHFNEEYDQKGTIVRRCKYCDRAFTAGVNRNATKMRYHLALYCTSIDEPTKQLLIGDNNGVFIRKPVRLPGGVRRHKSSNGGSKVWDCCWPGCDKKFSKHCQMITHHRVHTGERYHCDWPGCEWSGKSKNYLNLHKFTHSGEKPFVCDWPGCDFKSSRPASLRIHKMRHNNELNYRCDWPDCTRVFLTNSQLKVHRLVHSGDRPHACQLCDKRYPTFNKLKVHQNKQHPNQETV